MPPPRFIDNEAKEGDVTSEDEDLDEFNTNEVEPHDVAKIDEPAASPPTLYLVVVRPPTPSLSIKVNAMLQNAAVNNMFINSSTKFGLALKSEDAGTSRRFPMYFMTDEDPTRRSTFPCSFKQYQEVERTDRNRVPQRNTHYNNACATSTVSCNFALARYPGFRHGASP